MNRDELRQSLRFYQDLGVTDLYRVTPPPPSAVPAAPEVAVRSSVPPPPPAAPAAAAPHVEAPVVMPPRPAPTIAAAPQEPAAVAAFQEMDIVLPKLEPADDTLEKIQQDIGPDCRRCRLCEARSKIVFGAGNPESRLVFVGEGPGADEDQQGLPFVGRAGQLLTQMIEGTASKEGIPIRRPDVYICNVVKCRPPDNRTPLPDEMEICGAFLARQLMVIRPKAICALGSTAAKALLNTKDGVTRLRGSWHSWRDIPLIVTYHPSYLLRQYNQAAKREAWEDLKKVLHFVYD